MAVLRLLPPPPPPLSLPMLLRLCGDMAVAVESESAAIAAVADFPPHSRTGVIRGAVAVPLARLLWLLMLSLVALALVLR